MSQAKLTSKGQITIPKDIRDSLQLRTGDKIEFTMVSKDEAIIRPVTRKVADVFGKLHKRGRKQVSIRKIDAAIDQKWRGN